MVFKIIQEHPQTEKPLIYDEAVQDNALIQSTKDWRKSTLTHEELLKKIHDLRVSFSQGSASERQAEKIKGEILNNFDKVGIGIKQNVDLISLLDLL